MIANTHYGYVGKSKAPKFTYTGNYKVRDDGVVELLTSGTLVFLNPVVIDRFMVGGGGSGGWSVYGSYPYLGGGGGGGYTRTDLGVEIMNNSPINVTIGDGGELKATTATKADGKPTSWGDITVNGGMGGLYQENSSAYRKGRPGGSGGGGSGSNSSPGGQGGSDGSNGFDGGSGRTGGQGQGTTTREFGEPTGKLYAGGGGGARYTNSSTPQQAAGGAGGGGAGAWVYGADGVAAESGIANTGGGGGGGGKAQSSGAIFTSGGGGSGIVCFRIAK